MKVKLTIKPANGDEPFTKTYADRAAAQAGIDELCMWKTITVKEWSSLFDELSKIGMPKDWPKQH